MQAKTVFTRNHARDAGKELIGRLETADPDLLLLFPTTAEVVSHGINEAVDVLTGELDCPVVGASTGGFATAATDGFEMFGTAAVAIDGLTFDVERVENAWETGEDQLVDLLTSHGDDTVLTFETGSRAARDSVGWNTVKRLARHTLSEDTFGQRKRVIQRMGDMLHRYHIGYPNLFLARIKAGMQGQPIINVESGDAGDFLNGYELWNDTVTQSQAGTLLYTDHTFETGTAQDAAETLQSADVVETFDEVTHYNRVIYELDGQPLAAFDDTYSVGEATGRGGFTHYLLLETQGSVFAVPFPSDLGISIVVSYVPVDDDATAHLVRTPSFKQYRDRYEQMLPDLPDTGVPHISVNPPQMDCFRDQLHTVARKTAEHQDDFLITVTNDFRQYTNMEYNYPSYAVYE